MLIKQLNNKNQYLSLLLLFGKCFKFQLDVYNGCDDLLMMSMNLNDIAILNINGAIYCCILAKLAKVKP